MRVVLTGTPGTGKTEAAKSLAVRGFSVTSVKELAEKCGAAEADGGDVEIDVERLAGQIEKGDGAGIEGDDAKIVIEGHLAHHLPNDVCIVLRCDPNILRRRLEARGYSEEKVRENLEAEAVDLILVEAVEGCKKVFEVDASELSVEEVADAIESIIRGGSDCYPPGKVDWSQVVLDWY